MPSVCEMEPVNSSPTQSTPAAAGEGSSSSVAPNQATTAPIQLDTIGVVGVECPSRHMLAYS